MRRKSFVPNRSRLFAILISALVSGGAAPLRAMHEDAPFDSVLKDTNYPIPAGAVYVAPNGSPTRSGTSPSAPTTIENAVAKAPAGATIVFRGGTYRGVNRLLIFKRLTLQAFPHEKPWIKGSQIVTGWTRDTAGRWVKTGWTHAFASKMEPRYIKSDHPLAGDRDMVFLDGRPLAQVRTQDQVTPGTFCVDANTDKLYLGDNPDNKLVEATTASKAFMIIKGATGDPARSVVRGLGFEHFADEGINTGAVGIVLENNTFAWNGVRGAWLFGTLRGVAGNASTDVVVRGNTFHANGMVGLEGDRMHRALVENNTFGHNNVEGFATNWAAAGVKILHTQDLVLRRNVVDHNYAHGVWLDISCTKATVVGNTVRHNRIGIFAELSHDFIIAFNVCHDNTNGIQIADSSRIRVYNNTLVSNRINVVVKDTDRVNNNTNPETAGDTYNTPALFAAGVTWVTRDNVLKNNIFSNATGGHLLECSDSAPGDRSGLLIRAMDHNAYHRREAALPAKVIRWRQSTGKIVSYATVGAFRAVLENAAYERHALVIDGAGEASPFVDENAGDFRLRPGVMARWRAEPLPQEGRNRVRCERSLRRGLPLAFDLLPHLALVTGQVPLNDGAKDQTVNGVYFLHIGRPAAARDAASRIFLGVAGIAVGESCERFDARLSLHQRRQVRPDPLREGIQMRIHSLRLHRSRGEEVSRNQDQLRCFSFTHRVCLR